MRFNKRVKFLGIFLGIAAISALAFIGWRFSQTALQGQALRSWEATSSANLAEQGGSSDASINANINQSQKLDSNNLSEEIIEKRTENSKTRLLGHTDDGRAKYSLDSSIGAVHYKDNYSDPSEQWKDIDLTWEGNKITKAPYELTREGDKITVRDKKTGEVSTIELLDVKPAGLKREIVPENTRVSFRHTLPSDKVPFESTFRITGNIPLKTRAFDDEGELELETVLADNILTEKLTGVVDKETGEARPVKGEIRIDPTLDLQVGAGADDAFEGDNGSTFFSTVHPIRSDSNTLNSSRYNGGHRFTGVTIQGTTIDVAYVTVVAFNTSNDDPNVDILAEDVDNAVNFTTTADVTSRVRTTASVQWTAEGIGTGSVNSPSIVSVIQELADRASFANDAAVILIDGKSDTNFLFRTSAYDGAGADTTKTLKLHIEYTAAGSNTNFDGVDMQGINVN